MGKKNKGGNNPLKPKQQQPSFFMQMRQKYGDSWLNMVNTEFIRKNAMRIFKDMAYGSINVDYEFKYFLNYDFTYNLCLSAADNAKYCYMTYIGLLNNPMTAYDKDLSRTMQEHYDRFNLFNTIVIHLNSVLSDISINNGTLVRYYLQELVANIRWKKAAFNGYFITVPKEQDKSYIKRERRSNRNGSEFSKDDSGERGFFAQSN